MNAARDASAHLKIKSVFATDRRHITALSLSVDRHPVTVGQQARRLLPKFLLGCKLS
jgi:hypothetical protein